MNYKKLLFNKFITFLNISLLKGTIITVILSCMFTNISFNKSIAQQIILDNNTSTTLNINKSITNITTQTIKGNNAFNSFEKFNVYSGNTVNLLLPAGTQNLINLVNSEKTVVDGTLNSLINNNIGGNVFFVNPFGITIGASGTVNVGSLTAVSPTINFMQSFFTSPGNPDSNFVNNLISGNIPINPDSSIINNGNINAINNIEVNAGNFTNNGNLYTNATFNKNVTTGDFVNINSLDYVQDNNYKNLTLENGVIKVSTINNFVQNGNIFSGKDLKIDSKSLNLNPESKLVTSNDIFINTEKVSFNPYYSNQELVSLLKYYFNNNRVDFAQLNEYSNSLKSSDPIIEANNRIILGRQTTGNIVIGQPENINNNVFKANSLLLDKRFIERCDTQNLIIGNHNDNNSLTNNILLAEGFTTNNNLEINSNNQIVFSDIPDKLNQKDINNLNNYFSTYSSFKNIYNYQIIGEPGLEHIYISQAAKDNALIDILNYINSKVDRNNGLIINDLPNYFKILSVLYELDMSYQDYIQLNSLYSNQDLSNFWNTINLSSNDLNTLSNTYFVSNTNLNKFKNNHTVNSYDLKTESSQIDVQKGARPNSYNDTKLVADTFNIDTSSDNTSISAGNDVVISRNNFGDIVIANENFIKSQPADPLITYLSSEELNKVNCNIVIGNSYKTNNNTDTIDIQSTIDREDNIQFGTDSIFLREQAKVISSKDINFYTDNIFYMDNKSTIWAGNNIRISRPPIPSRVTLFLMRENAEMTAKETIRISGFKDYTTNLFVILDNARISARNIIIDNFYYVYTDPNTLINAEENLSISAENIDLEGTVKSSAYREVEKTLGDLDTNLINYLFQDEETNKVFNLTQDKKDKDEKLLKSVGNFFVEQVLFKGYTFEKEYMADNQGCRFAYYTGYHPQGMESFLRKIKIIEDLYMKKPSKTDNIVSKLMDYKHPPPKYRIEKLVKLVQDEKMETKNRIVNKQIYNQLLNNLDK